MGRIPLVSDTQEIKLGKELMVLVPLSVWRKIEDLIEDQEALSSNRYLRRIVQSRKEVAAGKVVRPFR